MATAIATPMQRADELLREMTIDEKAMQLSSVFPLSLDPWTSRFGDADFVVVVVGGVAA
jgi:hypothetical protein